jgi:Ca2+-binding EF-hand superfamily protein
MNHRKLLIGSLIGGMAAFGTAQADTGKARHGFPLDLGAMETRANAAFDRIDADGDGRITLDELLAAEDVGPVWGHGFRHHGAHRGPRGEGAHSAGKEGMTREERRAAMAERRAEWRKERFAALDTDGDGKLSPEELAAGRESRRTQQRERLFTRLDADQDGALTRDEWLAPLARLKAMDADGDGQVSKEEATAHRRARHRGSD